MTDIREQAARAAREWWARMNSLPSYVQPPPDAAFEMGYLAGYEAAKAEDEPFLICDGCGRTNAKCKCEPEDDDD